MSVKDVKSKSCQFEVSVSISWFTIPPLCLAPVVAIVRGWVGEARRCQQGNVVEYVLRVEGQHEIFTNF